MDVRGERHTKNKAGVYQDREVQDYKCWTMRIRLESRLGRECEESQMLGQGIDSVSLGNGEPLNIFEQGGDMRHTCPGEGQ